VEKTIDTTTGLLATPYCPSGLTQNQVFIQRPEPYTISPKGQIPLDAKYEAPIEYCNAHGPLDVFENWNDMEQQPSGVPNGNDDNNNNDNNNHNDNNNDLEESNEWNWDFRF